MRQRLAAQFEIGSVNEVDRTVDVVFYTGRKVYRGGFMIEPYELVMDFAGGQLDDLNSGAAPVLNAHRTYNTTDVVGNVTEGSARLEPGDTVEAADGVEYQKGEAFATLRYIDTPDVEPIWQRVRQRALRNVSMGVDIIRAETIKAEDRTDEPGTQMDLVIAREWSPYEISPVPLGADAGARTLSAEAEAEPEIVTRRGEQSMSTTTAPAPAEPTTAAASPVDQALIDQRVAEALAAREAREAAAFQTAKVTGYPEDQVKALVKDESLSIDDIRRKMVEHAAAQQVTPGGETCVEPGSDGRERLMDAIEGAVYRQVDANLFNSSYEEKRFEGRSVVKDDAETARVRRCIAAGRDFLGYPLMEMARKVLEASGWDTGRMGPEQLGKAALKAGHRMPAEFQTFRRGGQSQSFSMSTSDFPAVLRNAGTKILVRSYMDTAPFYERLSWRYDVKDFKTFYLPQRGDAPAPELVLEGGAYKRVVLGEREQSGKVQKKGMILPFTLEMLINDDLGAFMVTALDITSAFRGEEQDTWVDMVANPATLGDGVAVYDAAYFTLTASGAAPSFDSAAAVETALGKQRGINGKDGRPKNLQLYAVVGPTELKRGLATVFGPVNNVPDAVTNQKWDSITLGNDRIFTDARFSAESTTAWYGFANPMAAPVTAHGFITGMEGLMTETQNGFDVDGLEIKTRRVMHFTQVGRVGVVKNAGT